MEFKEFETFVKNIPNNCVVRVRIADNVLDDEDWPVSELVINNGLVVLQRFVHPGAYSIDNMVGWGVDEVAAWSSYDGTGHIPENFQEVSLGPNLPSKQQLPSDVRIAIRSEWESLEELLGAIDEPQCSKKMVKSHIEGVAENLRALLDYYSK